MESLPDQVCFPFTAYFRIDKQHARETLLEACNSFIQSYLGLNASIMEGNEVISFNDAALINGGGTIETKVILRLFKYFKDGESASMEEEELSFIAEG